MCNLKYNKVSKISKTNWNLKGYMGRWVINQILNCIFHYSCVSYHFENIYFLHFFFLFSFMGFHATTELTDINSNNNTKSYIFFLFLSFMGSNQYNVFCCCCCCCYLFFWLKWKAVNQWSNNYSSSDKKLELLIHI